MQFIYLHGFASGPDTYKGQYFQSKLRSSFQKELLIPNLNLPSFETLSIRSQLIYIQTLLTEDTVLIGSSLGAYLAYLSAIKSSNHIKALILIAPAFEFFRLQKDSLSPQTLKHWEESGSLSVYHHYYKENKWLHFGFYNEAEHFDLSPQELNIPILAFHGYNDNIIPFQLSKKYLSHQPQKSLHFYNDDHQLIRSLDSIWEKTDAFIEANHLIN